MSLANFFFRGTSAANGKNRTALLALFFCFLFLFTARHQWAADVTLSGDDASYLSYALTLGLDGDLEFSNEPAAVVSLSPYYRTPPHFYGPGLLATPFVALFSLIDRWQDHTVISDHRIFLNSWSYFGFSFAVHTYFLAGLLLFWRAARLVRPDISPLFVTLVCAGCGVVYYVLVRPRMAHGFEFFGLALTCYAALLAQAQRHWKAMISSALMLALGIAVVISTRPNNLNIVLLPLAVTFLTRLQQVPAAPLQAHLKPRLAMDSFAALLGLGVIVAINLIVYGTYFPNPKNLYGQIKVAIPLPAGLDDLPRFLNDWFLLLPQYSHIFFGSEFGLLYTNPLLVFGPLALLYLTWKGIRSGRWRLAVPAFFLGAAYLSFSLMIALIWRVPGDSYGWRYLFQLFPLCLVLYLLWSRGQASTSPSLRLTNILLIVLSLNGLVGSLLFSKSEPLSYSWGINSFGIEANRLDGFNTSLLREAARSKTWDTAIKDGALGYVRKNLFRRLPKDGGPLPPPENPPVVGLWLVMLAGLWVFAFLWIRRTASR